MFPRDTSGREMNSGQGNQGQEGRFPLLWRDNNCRARNLIKKIKYKLEERLEGFKTEVLLLGNWLIIVHTISNKIIVFGFQSRGYTRQSKLPLKILNFDWLAHKSSSKDFLLRMGIRQTCTAAINRDSFIVFTFSDCLTWNIGVKRVWIRSIRSATLFCGE